MYIQSKNWKFYFITLSGGFINEKTVDMRERKTRSQLRKCLSILLETKKIQNITVKELAQMADINRGTFYLHYKDVYDLMEHIQADLLKEFEDILTKIAPDTDNLVPFIEALFVFIYDNKDMAKIFLHDDLDANFSNELRNKLQTCVFNKYKAFIKQKNMPYFELYYDFILSGTLGLLVRWIDSEFEMSTHDLAVLTQSFIRNGLTNIIE